MEIPKDPFIFFAEEDEDETIGSNSFNSNWIRLSFGEETLNKLVKKNAKFVALGYDSAIESLIKEVEHNNNKITVNKSKIGIITIALKLIKNTTIPAAIKV